jgi:hypothetical protein
MCGGGCERPRTTAAKEGRDAAAGKVDEDEGEVEVAGDEDDGEVSMIGGDEDDGEVAAFGAVEGVTAMAACDRVLTLIKRDGNFGRT